LNRTQALEIYEIRAALEAEAAKHFSARASDEEMKTLRQAYDRAETLSLVDVEGYSREINRFFEILFDGARNATAATIMRSLHARISLLRTSTIRVAPKERLVGSMAQMKLILDALERRDAEAAAQACRAFVARSAEFAAQLLSNSPEPEA
jgi:GntR family transcriptional regulator, trigonelline degradation regulator